MQMLSPFCEKEPPRQYPWLSFEEHCSVLVIGGSLCACSVAAALARQGKDVVLLSPEPIGNESGNVLPFSRQSGILLSRLSRSLGIGEAVCALKSTMRAVERAASFAEENGISFARRSLLLAAKETHELQKLDEEYRLRLHNGFPVKLSFANELREQYSFPMKAALEIPESVLCADPVVLAQHFAAHAASAGARIYEQSAVLALSYQSGKWEAETATGRTVHAQKVLLTAPYATPLLNLPKRRIYAAASAPCPDFSGYQSKAAVCFFDSPVSFATAADDCVIAYSEESAAVPKALQERRFLRMEESCSESLCGTRPPFPERRTVYPYCKPQNGLPSLQKIEGENGLFALLCGADEITAAFWLDEEIGCI